MTEASLPESAYRSLLELNRQMHECRSIAELQQCLVSHVGDVIWADLVSFNTIDATGNMGGTKVILNPDAMPAAELVALFDLYLGQHPLVQASLSTGDGGPRRLTDLVDIEDFKRTELFEYVFKRLGVAYQLAFSVHNVPGMVIGVAINRASKDFSDLELAIAEILYSQIPSAFHHVQLSEVHERERQLQQAPDLSNREREILVYLRAGMSNADIAQSLMLGRRTVEKHLERIYDKLGVTNRTAAVTSVWPSSGAISVVAE